MNRQESRIPQHKQVSVRNLSEMDERADGFWDAFLSAVCLSAYLVTRLIGSLPVLLCLEASL